ncbi:MAG TPA: acyl-CoA dehydrogenase [Spirochaetes bacterium]|nr:acyl-CoA dehydrogenase [Spirochaetota bacterium]
MASRFISRRNLDFILYEVLDISALSQYPFFQDHNRESMALVMDTAVTISEKMMYPVFQEMDKKAPEFKEGRVVVHPAVARFMTAMGEGGWINALLPYESGGQQLPYVLFTAATYVFAAANYSLSVYPFLTAGAAHLIETFGGDELKEAFLPNMYAGKWQGTMALTEPDAGSSLTDVSTLAVPADDGSYRLRGQKIFISCGEYDSIENVVHLLLARIKGAPPGVKGISLFVVPNRRAGEDGKLVWNDVTCAGIYHKLGYRGAPITQLSLGDNDDCRGWLVGEPHRGLRCMFQMMNEARIDVGLGAAAIATAAYYASLEYARERPQGRRIDEKNPETPQIPIINHADVKRMLLYQKAVTEGALALILSLARWVDLIRVTEGEEKERYELLLDLLTPIAKTYPSETGIWSVSQGLQCLGGYGYCDEFPLEQYYRDIRIHPIHEGTTGIQGMDLLGRKVVMKNGKAFALFLEDAGAAIADAKKSERLAPRAEELERALDVLQKVTARLAGIALEGKIELFLADATLYLEMFGIIAVAWQWLVQAGVAAAALGKKPSEADSLFYDGKLFAFRFFFEYELPKIEGLTKRLMNADGLTVDMKPEHFED